VHWVKGEGHVVDANDAGEATLVLFPVERRERASIELVSRLAPSRSLVDTLIFEAGMPMRDTEAEIAAAFGRQVVALEAAYGRDEVIIKLRALVDAHVTYAAGICLDYRAVADRLMGLEVGAARAERLDGRRHVELHRVRAEFRGHAIAARVAADSALGAANVLASYVRDGTVVAQRSGHAEPEQLALFGIAG
jgi:hypothetical protein